MKSASALATLILILSVLLLAGCGGSGSGAAVVGDNGHPALVIPDPPEIHGIIIWMPHWDSYEVTRSLYDGRTHWGVGRFDTRTYYPQVGGGGYDAFLAKYDTDGNRTWGQLLGGAGDEAAYGVASNGDNAVYVVGTTNSPVMDNLVGAGGNDAFIARFDAAGNRLWTRLLGGSGDEVARHVAIGSGGDVFVAGSTTSSVLDNQAGAGGSDTFLVKYDNLGNRVWTRLLGGAGDEVVRDLKIDGSGNIYIIGSTTSSVLDNQTAAGGSDAFLAKYDANGNRVWARVFGGAGDDGALGLTIDGAGNAYIGGYSYSYRLDGWLNTTSYGNDNVTADAFLAKYDSGGNLAWSRLLGSYSNNFGVGLSMETNGAVTLAGLTGCDSLTRSGDYTPISGDIHFWASFDPTGGLLGISSMEEF